MTTEIERYEEQQPATTASLVEWARSATAAYSVAQKLVTTAFVPGQFRGKPDEATAAILAGAEVGLSPMASLKAFDIIQGQAAPRAITLRAVVQAAGHDIRVETSTPELAVVVGRRKGDTVEQRSEWTIQRARQLGVTGKDNWEKQPQAMLLARATSEICRLVAADAILGIPYSKEELEDSQRPESPQVRRPEPRAIAAAPAPQAQTAAVGEAWAGSPDFSYSDEDYPADDVDPHTGELTQPAPSRPRAVPNGERMASPKQLGLIRARSQQHGAKSREDAIAEIAGFLAEDITSSEDAWVQLTMTQARRVLDELWPDKAAA